MTQVNVLVVDDISNAARTFGDYIETKVRLGVAIATNADDAIAIAEREPIRVLVLDQKMPVTGTELFSRLRHLLPHAKAIMLTQEEDADARSTALNLGYSYWLHKSDISELPERVLELFLESLGEEANATRIDHPIVLHRQRRLGRVRQTVRLLSVEILDGAFLDDIEWRAYLNLHVGETQTRSEVSIRKGTFRVENETESTLTARIGVALPFPKLSESLQAAVRKRNVIAETREASITQRLEQTFTLPAEVSDPTSLHVVSRQLEWAPVYRRARVVLDRTCPKCGTLHRVPLVIREPRDVVALRTTDYLSDGSSQQVFTGFRSIQP